MALFTLAAPMTFHLASALITMAREPNTREVELLSPLSTLKLANQGQKLSSLSAK